MGQDIPFQAPCGATKEDGLLAILTNICLPLNYQYVSKIIS